MVSYTCNNCEKVFAQKGHYDSHKNRKRPCKKNDAIERIVEKKVEEVLARTAVLVTDTPALPKEYLKPFMKWVGGKTQIITDVIAKFPKEMNNYHEPFLGGGSVLLALLSCKQSGTIRVSGTIYASDLNSNLIGLYKNIQSHPDTFIDEVKKLVEEFVRCENKTVNRTAKNITEALTSQESYYFWIRARFNALSKEDRASIVGSSMLLFLNKTCFRGVYREGPRGFNVPFGNYKNPTILDEDDIKTVSVLIQGVVFSTCTFAESFNRVVYGDFMYLDPPYAPETDKSFVAYNSDGFKLDNHKLLFELCAGLKQKSVKMLMSNADVHLVKEAFPSPNYMTKIISCRRAINSKEPDSRTNEVLITN